MLLSTVLLCSSLLAATRSASRAIKGPAACREAKAAAVLAKTPTLWQVHEAAMALALVAEHQGEVIEATLSAVGGLISVHL